MMVELRGPGGCVRGIAALALALAACGGGQTPPPPPPGGGTEPAGGQTMTASTPDAAVASDDAAVAAATDTLDAGASPASDGDSGASATTASADAGSTAPPATAVADAGPPPPPYTGPPPWVFLRPTRVATGLAPEAAARVFRRNQPAVVTCYTQRLATNPTTHGTLTIRVNVIAGGLGQVQSVRFAPRVEPMEECIHAAMARWEWPNPHGAPSAEITFTADMAPVAPPHPGH